jgi:hypothetical protein
LYYYEAFTEGREEKEAMTLTTRGEQAAFSLFNRGRCRLAQAVDVTAKHAIRSVLKA